MFQLFKATAMVAIANLASIIMSIVKTKFLAVKLGPSGVGIFSQASNFVQFLVTVSSLSLGLGVTKYVSAYHAEGKDSKVEGVISCALWMQLIASCASFLLVILLAATLSNFLFASNEYGPFLIIASIGIPFFLLSATIDCIFLAVRRYKVFAWSRSLAAVLSLLPLFILISMIAVRGGFLFIAAQGILIFAISAYFLFRGVLKEVSWRLPDIVNVNLLKGNFKKFGKDLLSYGGVIFVTGIFSSLTVVFLRSLVIRYFGPEANGHYQVVYAVSVNYLAFFTNGLWSYFYPKVSALRDKRKYSLEMNYAIRFCIFGIVPCITALYILRGFIINVAFSNKFIAAGDLFATQLAGDLFYLLFYIAATALLATVRLRAYLVFGIFYSVSYIFFFLALKGQLGLKALTVSYLISSLLSFLAVVYYDVKRTRLKVYARNGKLFLWGCAVIAATLFVEASSLLVIASKIGIVFLWLYFMSTNSEKKKVRELVLKKSKALFGYA